MHERTLSIYCKGHVFTVSAIDRDIIATVKRCLNCGVKLSVPVTKYLTAPND